MKFYARLVFICNVCFLLAVSWQVMDIFGSKLNDDALVGVNPFVAIILVLYFLSVLVNGVFAVIALYLFLFKKAHNIPRWLIYANLLVLVFQLYYFFLS